MSWAVVKPGSLSTASFSLQWPSFEFLTFSMMDQWTGEGSSLEWCTAEVATGGVLAKLVLRLLEAKEP